MVVNFFRFLNEMKEDNLILSDYFFKVEEIDA
jgi:hypothetical protein